MVRRWPSASHNFDRSLIIILLWFRLWSSGFWDVLCLSTDTSVVEEHAASIFMAGIIRFRLDLKSCLKGGYLYMKGMVEREEGWSFIQDNMTM